MAKHTKVNTGRKTYFRQRVTIPGHKPKDIYATTVKELEAKVAAYRAATPPLSETKKITVRDYVAQQLRIMKKGVVEGTYVNYESKLRLYLIEPLGDIPLADVTSDDLAEIMAEMEDQSKSSYRVMYMLLRRIFRAALAAHKISEDPTENLSSTGGKPAKKRKFLTDEQVEVLLRAVAGLTVELFIRIGLYLGLRREETLALQWDCVHLDAESPYVEIRRTWHTSHNRPVITDLTKTEAGTREIPIPDLLLPFFLEAKAKSTSDFVIANADGGPLSGTQWRNLWKQVTTRSTVERTYKRYRNGTHTTHTITPQLGATAKNNPDVVYTIDFPVTSHMLRRTYITNLVRKKVDPKTVQYLAGHEKIDITLEIYAQFFYNKPEQLAKIVNEAYAAGDTEE